MNINIRNALKVVLITSTVLFTANANALIITQNQNVNVFFLSSSTPYSFSGYGGTGTLDSVELSWSIIVNQFVSTDLCLSLAPSCQSGIYSISLSGNAGAFNASGTFDQDSDTAGFDFLTDAFQTGLILANINGSTNLANTNDFLAAGTIGDVLVDSLYDGFIYTNSTRPPAPNPIDPVTGLLTLTYNITEQPPSQIPAPATIVLLATGLAGFGFSRRKQQQS